MGHEATTTETSTSSARRLPGARVVVVLPAYNAARTLAKTYGAIPRDLVSHVLLVDDCSRDETVRVAQALGIEYVRHESNRGYGANQKTCYRLALDRGADIVVMLHPDYQYDPAYIPALVEPILNGQADLMLGSRLLDGGALRGGMPLYKYFANRALTAIENAAFGTRLSELHTGFRAYSRALLTAVPFEGNSDDFVFDSEIIAQAIAFGFRVGEIAVPCRYFPEASSINFARSVRYGIATLGVVVKYLLHRTGLQHPRLFLAPSTPHRR